MNKVIVACAVMLISLASLLPATWAETAVPLEPIKNIETRMTAEQFKQSGLHKLSDEELATLNQWLKEQKVVNEAQLAESLLQKAQAVNEKESFGMDNSSEKAVQEINSTVTSLRKNPYKKYILLLENGQEWEQKEVDTIDFEVGDEVTIKRAVFGSFTLKHNRTGLATKVKRRK